MELQSRKPPQDSIEYQGGPSLVPWIIASLFPAAYDIKARIKLFHETNEFLWVVLQVSIHGDNRMPLGNREASRERGSFAKVAPKADSVNRLIFCRDLLNDRPRLVDGPVVNEKHFEVP